MADPEDARDVMRHLVQKASAMVDDIRKIVALDDPDGSGEDWPTLQAQEVRACAGALARKERALTCPRRPRSWLRRSARRCKSRGRQRRPSWPPLPRAGTLPPPQPARPQTSCGSSPRSTRAWGSPRAAAAPGATKTRLVAATGRTTTLRRGTVGAAVMRTTMQKSWTGPSSKRCLRRCCGTARASRRSRGCSGRRRGAFRGDRGLDLSGVAEARLPLYQCQAGAGRRVARTPGLPVGAERFAPVAQDYHRGGAVSMMIQ